MKNILVTGATRGLGRGIAEHLLAEGWRVIGTGRAAAAPADWPDSPNLAYKQLQLEEWAGHHAFVKGLQDEFGPLYGLVNNAALGKDGILATMHEKDIETVIAVNVTGTIVLTKYAVRSMLPHGEGRVVNIASIIATTGFNGLSVYGATKSALLGFTRSLGRELGRANITVNSVSPGYMRTDMSGSISEENLKRIQNRSPLGRLVEPSDVAGVVALLLSPAGANMTGVDVKVDAGSTI
jgi:3-oxoacyl-[acyl-carrier protein] reductase